MSVTARRALEQASLGAFAIAVGAAGVALVGTEWRGVLAGALIAWGASAAIWSMQTFRAGQRELVDELRRSAERDVLHARLNVLGNRLGIHPIDLNSEWDAIVRARMERLAHFSGLDEFRVFGDDWMSPEDTHHFWTAESLGT